MAVTLAGQIARVVAARLPRKKLEEHGPRTSVCLRLPANPHFASQNSAYATTLLPLKLRALGNLRAAANCANCSAVYISFFFFFQFGRKFDSIVFYTICDYSTLYKNLHVNVMYLINLLHHTNHLLNFKAPNVRSLFSLPMS